VAGMQWKKSPPELVARFDEVVPREPSVERRSMFGYPSAFTNGHMFCGLFQDRFILRLPEAERTKFLKQAGAAVFEPMPGRPMKEYVVVPPNVVSSDSSLERWLGKALGYVSSLPSKAPKRKAPKKAAAAKAPKKRARR
jgi:TfoX/Sxy family transcriptional regulator of competence genes